MLLKLKKRLMDNSFTNLFFVSIFTLFSSFSLMAQSSSDMLIRYEKVIEGIKDPDIYQKQKVFDSLKELKYLNFDNKKMIYVYKDFLKSYYAIGNYKYALIYGYKIYSIGVTFNNTQDSFFEKNHRNIVLLNIRNEDYYTALKYANIYIETYKEQNLNLGKLKRLLGIIYYELGDYKKAITYYDSAIYIFKKIENYKQEITTQLNLMEVYATLKTNVHTEAFLAALNRLNTIDNLYKLKDRDKLKMHFYTGVFFGFLNDYVKAKENYNIALNLSKKIKDSTLIFKTLINLGIINKKEGHLDVSKVIFDKASQYNKNDRKRKASLYNNIADVFKKERNYKKALVNYNKAIDEITGNNNLSQEYLNILPNKVDLLGYIIDKANLLMLVNTNNKDTVSLKHALDIYTIADQLVDNIYFESREDFSKLFWRQKADNFYTNATEAAYLLNKPDTAFYFIEKSKALLLLENITANKAKLLAEFPEAIINREYKLLSTIKKTETELHTLKSTTPTKIIDDLKDQVFTGRQTYTNFIDSLETAYPKYHSFKKKIEIYDAQKVQKSLDGNTILLQYKLTTDKGFVSLITKDETSIHQLNNVAQLHNILVQYKDILSRPLVNIADQKLYKTIAYQLFNELFPFLADEFHIYNNKKLIIIPDQTLSFLPFEALITDQNQDITSAYLINLYEISYAYSYSSLMIGNDQDYETDFYAISPSSFKDNSLTDLPILPETALNLKALFNTKIISHKAATKQQFLEAYGHSKIVHISTHGGLEDNQPWIAFNDKKLMLNDIYFKNQHANLVLLSACKTSQGELKKGEGIMSVARGFINTGSSSVVSSLWDINQKSTNQIVTTFYTHLKKGASKSEALRTAKLAYINKYKGTSDASPFYWSALVLTGNSDVIFQNYNAIWYTLATLIILIFLVYIFKIRTNNKTLQD